MALVGMEGLLELKGTSWHVHGEFEFEERNGMGTAALVEGETLVLFHADSHMEAVALAGIEGLEFVPGRLTAIVMYHAGRRLVLQGDVHSMGALQQAAGSRQRRAPAWVWAEPEEG
jgi:hypothetical protein